MTKYNQRQYARMIECLNSFIPTLQSVRGSESTITALTGCLESPDKSWLGRVQKEVGQLEVISALAYAADRQELTDSERKWAVEHIENLKKLVQEVYVPPAEDEIPEDWL